MNLKKNTLAVSILSALMVTACGGSGGVMVAQVPLLIIGINQLVKLTLPRSEQLKKLKSKKVVMLKQGL